MHHTFAHQPGTLQHFHQRRNVLAQQLLLEVDGVGGDDHPPSLGNRKQYRGKQVSHGLAHAGATLYDQVVALIDGSGHPGQHLFLLRPVFETGKGPGEGPFRAEKLYEFCFVQRGEAVVRAPLLGLSQPVGEIFQVQAGHTERGWPAGCGGLVQSR